MHLTGLCMHVLHALPHDVTGRCMQLLPGMSDPNKRYDRRNGNSCTVKITFFRTGQIILPSLGKLFRLIYFPRVLPTKMRVRSKSGEHRQ
jgi:hypothetical protein